MRPVAENGVPVTVLCPALCNVENWVPRAITELNPALEMCLLMCLKAPECGGASVKEHRETLDVSFCTVGCA
jgi:hypothetical protein